MLNPNALSHRVLSWTACYSEDRAVFSSQVKNGSGTPHADFQQSFMQVTHPVSYLSDLPGSLFHHSLHYRCVLNMPADMKKSHIQNTKTDYMNGRHELKSPKAFYIGLTRLVLEVHQIWEVRCKTVMNQWRCRPQTNDRTTKMLSIIWKIWENVKLYKIKNFRKVI